MNDMYIKLFTEIAHMTEILSEKVLEVDSKNNNSKGVTAATTMRDDYAKLYDKLRDKNFNPETLTRAEFAKFLVGAIVVSQNFETQAQKLNDVVKGYRMTTIPKLERIVNETSSDEEARKLANEIFQVNN